MFLISVVIIKVLSTIYLSSRSVSLTTVSTCVEATKCKYAPDLEAMKVDIPPIASAADNEDIKSSVSVGISCLVGLSTRSRMATIMPWGRSNKK